MITEYHAKYFAHELTKRCPSDSIQKLAGALADAQVDLNPHQIDAALFAFQSPLSKGAILADEVGLGKTIEAGILLSQKWAERKRKLLILVPANLRKQWNQELTDKFFLPSTILETRTFHEKVKSGKKLNDEDAGKLALDGEAKQDRGFKAFKLQTSNFTAWNSEMPKDDEQLVKQLELHIDHLVPGRGQEDVLYELLLKSGFPLTTKVESIMLADKTVFSVADGAMLICLEKELTPEVIKAMADKKPERVVCLDEGFAGNDQLKTNAVQTMKAKGVTKFQTV